MRPEIARPLAAGVTGFVLGGALGSWAGYEIASGNQAAEVDYARQIIQADRICLSAIQHYGQTVHLNELSDREQSACNVSVVHGGDTKIIDVVVSLPKADGLNRDIRTQAPTALESTTDQDSGHIFFESLYGTGIAVVLGFAGAIGADIQRMNKENRARKARYTEPLTTD